jgi:hypothetical protein
VRALEIAQLDQLVAAESGMPVGNDEVAFPGDDEQVGRELGGVGSCRIHDEIRAQVALSRPHRVRLDRGDRATLAQDRAVAAGLLQEVKRGGGRIEHAIIGDQEPTRQAGPETRLSVRQLSRVQYFGGNAGIRQGLLLGAHHRKLFVVFRDPDRAAALVFDARGKPGCHRVPESAGVGGECELLRRVVHGDQVAHTRRGGPAAGEPRFQHQHPAAAAGEGRRACRSHDSRPDHDGVVPGGAGHE